MWARAEMFLPEDLGRIAQDSGAIHRPRRVTDAAQLLRAFLVYSSVGSFRTAAALVSQSLLLEITAEGLHYRLKHAEGFLERILAHLVTERVKVPVGYRLLVVDATTVCGPGSKGTDWRIHVSYDPLRGLPCSVSVSDSSVGEHLCLHDLPHGSLVLADRGYGTATNVDEALRAGASLLIRVQKGLIRLWDESGRVNWDLLESQVPSHGATSLSFQMPVPPADRGKKRWSDKDAVRCHRVRLIGARNSIGEVVWLLTNLDESRLPSSEACQLYRARWQVELYFKRLKSLGDLDVLNSREGPTARASLLAKMILLVLTSLLRDEDQAFSPYGYPMRQTRTEPVAGVQVRPHTTRRQLAAGQSPAEAPAGVCAV